MPDVSIVEMTAVAAINEVAQNCANGMTSMWDVEFLETIGLNLSEESFFKIANGLTTVDDVEPLWDCAFYTGVI